MFPPVETMKKYHFTNRVDKNPKYVPILHFEPVNLVFSPSSFLSAEIKEQQREMYKNQNILAEKEEDCLRILTHINIWRNSLIKGINFIFVLCSTRSDDTVDTWKLEEEKALNQKLQAYKTNCVIKFSKGYIMSKNVLEEIIIGKWKQIEWKDLWKDLEREVKVITLDL